MPQSEKAWLVVHVRNGSSVTDDVTIHTAFDDHRIAELLCDILNRQAAAGNDEFRVMEVPRIRVVRRPA